jgi:hypothetical protein
MAADEFKVEMAQVFGGGVAYAMGTVEPERDWDKSSAAKFVQKTDPGTGLRVWSLVVADPASASQRKIKILCDDEPVIPEPSGGMPFVPVEFVDLTVRPWLDDRGCRRRDGKRCGCRIEMSLRARGVRAIPIPTTSGPDSARPAPRPESSNAA